MAIKFEETGQPQSLLETAKRLILDFCEREYDSSVDFSDLQHIGLAFTTTEDEIHQLQVEANLADFSMCYLVDGKLTYQDTYKNLSDMIEAELSALDFDCLISICADHIPD